MKKRKRQELPHEKNPSIRIRSNPDEDRRDRRRKISSVSDAKRVIYEYSRAGRNVEAAEILNEWFVRPLLDWLNEPIYGLTSGTGITTAASEEFRTIEFTQKVVLWKLGRALASLPVGRITGSSVHSGCYRYQVNTDIAHFCASNNFDGTVTLGGQKRSVFESSFSAFSVNMTLTQILQQLEDEDPNHFVTIPLQVAMEYFSLFSKGAWQVIEQGTFRRGVITVERRPVLRARHSHDLWETSDSDVNTSVRVSGLEYVVHWENSGDSAGYYNGNYYGTNLERAYQEFRRREYNQ